MASIDLTNAVVQPIILKYSDVAGTVPTLENLRRGELAINVADGVLFTCKAGATEAQDEIISMKISDALLATLGDVTVSGLSNGQSLVYDSASSTWKNANLASANISDFETAVKEIIGSELGASTNYVDVTSDQDVDGVKTFADLPLATAAQTIEGADDELTKLGVVKTQTMYTDSSENGATVAVGGVAKGTKYSNTSIIQVIDDILHPYVAPSGVGLTLTAGGGVFEMGSSISITTGTVKWTNGSQLITKAEILKGSTSVAEKTLSASATSATIAYTDTITSNTTFTARVTDATKTTSGGSVAYTFVYPYYWGVVDSSVTVPTADQVTGLTKVVQSKGAKTFAYTSNNQKMVIAYPASYGALKSVLDPNNFENIGGFTQNTVSITGLDGTAQNYYVYVANSASNVTSYNMKFSY